MNNPVHPTVIDVDGKPRSSCHRAELTVEREVGDLISYSPERLDPAEGESPATLLVRFAKVHESDADEYVVTCNQCGAGLDVAVTE
jgi:hypothetical protein